MRLLLIVILVVVSAFEQDMKIDSAGSHGGDGGSARALIWRGPGPWLGADFGGKGIKIELGLEVLEGNIGRKHGCNGEHDDVPDRHQWDIEDLQGAMRMRRSVKRALSAPLIGT